MYMSRLNYKSFSLFLLKIKFSKIYFNISKIDNSYELLYVNKTKLM